MFIHIFLFRWSLTASDAHKINAIREIAAFQGTIPGLHEVSVGRNVSPRSGGFELGGVMKFSDSAAYRAYQRHPAHVALLSWLQPLIEAVEVDFPL
jgi:hypothetical protein